LNSIAGKAQNFSGPGGVATFSAKTHDPTAAVARTEAVNANTAYEIASVQQSLDATLNHLNGAMLETTTVDPGTLYGSEVKMNVPSGTSQRIFDQTSWNGDFYNFDFRFSKVKFL
jgi:hypothetical protein